MSGSGRPGADPVEAAGLTLAIVATRWHAEITGSLVERAVAAAENQGAEPIPEWQRRVEGHGCHHSVLPLQGAFPR